MSYENNLRLFLESAIRHEPRLWRNLLIEAEEWAPRDVVRDGLFDALKAMDVRVDWAGPKGSRTIALAREHVAAA